MVRLHYNPLANPVNSCVHFVFAGIEDIETHMPGFIEVGLFVFKYAYVSKANT